MQLELTRLLEIHDGGLDADGCFVGRAIVTGGPIVLDYTHPHGVHIFRPEAEVFDQASMDSLKLIPLTDGHPVKNLTAADIRHHAIGWTGEQVTRIGNNLAVNFKVTDARLAKACDAAQKGGRAVRFSIGAKARPERQTGIHDGKNYQITLYDIRYNHLALLLNQPPRYPGTRLIDALNDSQIAEDWLFLMDGLMTATDSDITTEEKTVDKELPNGAKIELSDADARQLDNHLLEHTSLKGRLATKEGENATLKRQLEQAQSQIMDDDKLSQAIADRLKLAAQAQPLLKGKTIEEIAAMDAVSIQEAILIADGATADDLAQEKQTWGDQYPAFLAGAYTRALGAKGQQQSQGILDAAGQASKASREAQGQGDSPLTNRYQTAKKKMDERMEAKRKGVTV
jgi:hypothetical protein